MTAKIPSKSEHLQFPTDRNRMWTVTERDVTGSSSKGGVLGDGEVPVVDHDCQPHPALIDL